ncbi:multidrug ABC transporter permease [Streptococcus bovimastitidis]|uniref:Multidrug ABC transporter permease n=1 Tax=Streptococcus bovimastitidis TaxID=1856638 RepID=A0A1L8MLY9_9STRE|nr:ABC transporter permease [Streptococcus bovimastitidis]OJF71772.1 multidrug ABC transporter permease [Streptococcus bovimastitidis]
MIATIERHLKLYFNQKAGVFFSLLGALIAFILYLVFLQHNLEISWKESLPHPTKYLDLWVMGGVLAVTAITTSWAALSRIVTDKEESIWDDFLLTDVSPVSLNLGYFLSGTIISFIMQLVVLSIMALYFQIQDQVIFDTSLLPQLALVAFLGALQSSLFATIVLQFIGTKEVESRVSTIIGTASGFLVGVYMPIGVLPDAAQTLVKLTPGAYIASLYRQILLKSSLADLGKGQAYFKEFMGIGIKLKTLSNLNQDYQLVLLTIGILLVIMVLVVFFKSRQK